MMRLLVRVKQSRPPLLWGFPKKRPLSDSPAPAGKSTLFRDIAIVGGGLLSLLTFMTANVIQKEMKEIYPMISFKKSLRNKTYPVTVFPDYVQREKLEELITHEMTKEPDGTYCILYGNIAAGKSSLLTKCATPTPEDPKKGYLRIQIPDIIDSPDFRESVKRLVLDGLDIKDMSVSINEVRNAFRQVSQRTQRAPVLVIEIERTGQDKVDPQVLHLVRSIAKSLAEMESCNCFVVLSEPMLTAPYTHQHYREKYIFVDELTIPEATKYLQQSFKDSIAISEEEMKEKIFNKIGTHPGTLQRLVAEYNSGQIKIDDFVENVLCDAVEELHQFPFQTILKALKELKNPDDGVPLNYFGNIRENDVQLCIDVRVSNAIILSKRPNVIIEHQDTGRYHLLSTAHKTAMGRYTPTPIPSTIIYRLAG